MKIEIWQIGKKKDSTYSSLQDEYVKRLRSIHKIEYRYFKEADHKNLNASAIKEYESSLMLVQFKEGDYTILLDEHAKQLDSLKFSKYINSICNNPQYSRIIFCIGGAYGFSDQIRQKTKSQLSISKMTLAHRMVPLILLEQLYRAHTINIGHAYHKI